MNRPPDVLFINFDSAPVSYQELAVDFAAIEPPTWSLLLAQSRWSKGFGALILDGSAESLTLVQAVVRISEFKPCLACFVVYGQKPNSGTTNVTGNTGCTLLLKESHLEIPACFVGSHISVLPGEVLRFPMSTLYFLMKVFLHFSIYSKPTSELVCVKSEALASNRMVGQYSIVPSVGFHRTRWMSICRATRGICFRFASDH